MDKKMVAFLSDCGWSQSKIARRVGVNRSLVCRFLNLIKNPQHSLKKTRCEICNNQIKEEQYIEIEGVSAFLACKRCIKRYQES